MILQRIKEWLNSYVEVSNMVTGPTYVKRKYRLYMWFDIIFFMVLFFLILILML